MVPNELLQALYQRAGEHLAGMPVELRWEAPEYPHRGGSVTVFDDLAVIEIDPSQDADEIYRVFLHECAHVHNGIGARAAPMGADAVVKGLAELSQVWDELRAHKQATSWERWAERNAILGNSTLSKLIALMNWRSEDARITGHTKRTKKHVG